MNSADKTFNIVSLNVQSGSDTELCVVEEYIQRVKEEEGPIHLWALQEVAKNDIDEYHKIINQEPRGRQQSFKEIHGKTGGHDRLAIYYDEHSFKLIERKGKELFIVERVIEEVVKEKLTEEDEKDEFYEEISCWSGGMRLPLLAEFKFKVGPLKDQHLSFVNNHLKAKDFDRPKQSEQKRKRQASDLRKWVKKQDSSSAIILAGDYNFGVNTKHIDNKEKWGDAFKEFMKGNTFKWAKTKGEEHGFCKDNVGILDFVFLAGAAKEWSYEAKFLFEHDKDYCEMDKEGGSDHRPLLVKLTLP